MADETVQEKTDDLLDLIIKVATGKLINWHQELASDFVVRFVSEGDSPDAQSIVREAINEALTSRLAGIRKLIDAWPNRCKTCGGGGYVDCRDSCDGCNRSGIANYWEIRKLLEGTES